MTIIRIHPTEELTSIIDRLEKEEASEIVLEIPSGARIFRSIINLKLLKRWVESLNKLVTISTQDENGKFLAQIVGFSTPTLNSNMTQKPKTKKQENIIKVVKVPSETPNHKITGGIKPRRKSIRMTDIIRRRRRKPIIKRIIPTIPTERVVFPKPKPKPKSEILPRLEKPTFLPAISSKSIFIFLLVAVVAAGFALFLILPRAKIEILPKTEPLSLDLEVIADTNLDTQDFLTQKIPAKIIVARSRKSEKFPATERKQLRQKAKGIIQVSNEWSSQSQTLVKTTRFLSEGGKLFRTLKTVVVPGAQIVDGEARAGTIDVEVEAADIGEDFNIGPSTFKIPAFKEYNQLKKYASIYGKSKDPMTGGANREDLVVGELDLEDAKVKLIQELSEKVRAEFQKQTSQGYKLIEGTPHLEEKVVSISHKVGEATQDFSIEAELTIEAIVFSEQILKTFLNDLVYSKVSQDKVLVPETQKITYVKAEPDFERGRLKLDLHLEATLIFKIDESLLKERLAGKDKSQVTEILSTLPTIERAKVSLWPFWVKKVPSLPRKIHIQLTK